MATIKAPFNFVPVSDNVFFPDWAEQISQDIPFEDGESGMIELTITAESPIFVRNGHTKGDADDKNDNFKSFSKVNDKYFIPATTIKGAIRNVLEIISFSKMDKIANTRYSLRDLQLKKDYLDFFQNSNVHCGWMSKQGDTIIITNHGIPQRISHTDLDRLWGTHFSNIFKDSDLLKKDDKRTALYKINLSKGKNKEVQYNEFYMNSVNPVDKRIVVKIDSAGQHRGTIVLTGQPSARKDRVLNPDKTVKYKGNGKCYEFVFPNNLLGIVKEMNIYEDQLYKDFCFIYKDSEDWKYWKKQMENDKSVPVFFSLANNELIHFGLSYLYKLPYKKKIKDCLSGSHKKNDLDLSECIFGTTQRNKELKGRVQFSHAFWKLDNTKLNNSNELEAYMGSPKSSYYPIYLQQEGNDGYMTKPFITMMSDNARLKGWKRYPVRNELMPFTIPEGQNDNVNPFIPLQQGTIFKCLIRFHNLRKMEIGALLKAIHFNNKGFHSLGFAKPYGYGKVKINAELKQCKFTKDEYISAFNSLMQNEIADYLKTQELRELSLMGEVHKTKSPLKYMELSEFVDCKRQKKNKKGELEIPGEYLQYYSELIENETRDVVEVEVKATVTFGEKGIFKAKLLEGKDTSPKTLKVEEKIKPKTGDSIMVKVIKKGGNIDYLMFLKKI